MLKSSGKRDKIYKNNIYKTKVVIKNEAKDTILRGNNEICSRSKERQNTQFCCSSLLLSHV